MLRLWSVLSKSYKQIISSKSPKGYSRDTMQSFESIVNWHVRESLLRSGQ
jgi:hypothetical protein